MPDGGVVQGVPEGTPKAEILRRYQAANTATQGGQDIAKAQQFPYGAGDAAINGAAFGFGPEVQHAAQSATPFLGKAASADEIRQGQSAYRAEHPVANAAAELAGGIVNPVSSAWRGAKLAAPVLERAAAKIPQFLRTAGTTTAAGAAYGAGDNPQDRTGGAVTGAEYGAAAGTAIPGVGKLVSKGVTPAKNLVNSIRAQFDPAGVAVSKLNTAAGQDATTPAHLQSNLNRLGPTATIADAGGENIRALGAQAAGKPSPERAQVTDMLNGRDAPQPQPSAFYPLAYKANPIMTSAQLGQIMSRPGAKAAAKSVEEGLANAGAQAPRGSLAYYDEVKQQIDAKINWDAAQGADARNLKALRDDLVKELDRLDQSGFYAKARKLYEVDSGNADEAVSRFSQTRTAVKGSQGKELPGDPALEHGLGRAGAIIGSMSPFGHPLVASGVGRKVAETFLPKPATGPVVDALFSSNPQTQQQILAKMMSNPQAPTPAGTYMTPAMRALALAMAQQQPGNR